MYECNPANRKPSFDLVRRKTFVYFVMVSQNNNNAYFSLHDVVIYLILRDSSHHVFHHLHQLRTNRLAAQFLLKTNTPMRTCNTLLNTMINSFMMRAPTIWADKNLMYILFWGFQLSLLHGCKNLAKPGQSQSLLLEAIIPQVSC